LQRACLVIIALFTAAWLNKNPARSVGFSDWFGLLAGACPSLGFGVKAARGQGGVI